MDSFALFERQLLQKIRQLPREKVIEVEHFIDSLMQQQTNWHEEIAAMADDPEIQAEIAAINEEFAIAELDGLKDS